MLNCGGTTFTAGLKIKSPQTHWDPLRRLAGIFGDIPAFAALEDSRVRSWLCKLGGLPFTAQNLLILRANAW
jgi:hypothetical protein